MEDMHTGPRVNLTAYDYWDDNDCTCETCTTPWGTDIPDLLVRAVSGDHPLLGGAARRLPAQ